MYYHKILRVWIFDALDYFLLSMMIGSIVASLLKQYLAENNKMERLKKSIIKKSKLIRQSDQSISNSKEIKIKKIYKFALGNRGGQFQEFKADYEFSNEVLKLAQEIKNMVERLARFLKERELKGLARIFFKNGRLLLELILYKCRIGVTYSLLNEGLSNQVIVITATAGGAAGFTISWFSAGASLIAPPLLISILLLRSVAQQIINKRDYLKFKMLVNKMLDDEELKETILAFFPDIEAPRASSIEMKPWDTDKNLLLQSNLDSDQTFEEFIKARMKEELGLIENTTPEELEELINTRKIRKKPKGKTVFFKNFINQTAEYPDDVIDAEIVKEVRKVKVKNQEL